MQSILVIDGMRTVHCVRAVFTALAGVPEVERASVEMGGATVEHHTAIPQTALAAAVEAAGYDLRDVQTDQRTLPTLHLPTDG